jgi:FkbM family methyltransferase
VFDITELQVCRDLDLAGPGDVVFDVGANNGVLSLAFASFVGARGHVFAFDLIEQNVELIEANAALNDARNITAICAAVGDATGETALSLDSACVAQDGIAVRERTLDEFADQHPQLLKIDVEGYEAAVLRGATQVLEHTPNLILELHPTFSRERYGTGVEQTLALIDWDRYDAWVMRAQTDFVLEPWTGDKRIDPQDLTDWIFARAKRQGPRGAVPAPA